MVREIPYGVNLEPVPAILRHHIQVPATCFAFGRIAAGVHDHFRDADHVEMINAMLSASGSREHVRAHPVIVDAAILGTSTVNDDAGVLLTLVATHVIPARLPIGRTQNQ